MEVGEGSGPQSLPEYWSYYFNCLVDKVNQQSDDIMR